MWHLWYGWFFRFSSSWEVLYILTEFQFPLNKLLMSIIRKTAFTFSRQPCRFRSNCSDFFLTPRINTPAWRLYPWGKGLCILHNVAFSKRNCPPRPDGLGLDRPTPSHCCCIGDSCYVQFLELWIIKKHFKIQIQKNIFNSSFWIFHKAISA